MLIHAADMLRHDPLTKDQKYLTGGTGRTRCTPCPQLSAKMLTSRFISRGRSLDEAALWN
jgi:hypothetical protein